MNSDYTSPPKDIIKADYMLITRENFEAFLKCVNGLFYRMPHNNSAVVRASFDLQSGVTVTIAATAFDVKKNGTFYGRVDAWSHIRFSSWLWNNVHLAGKGARSEETNQQVREIMSLIAQFE